VKKETIVIDDFVTVKVFSEKMGVPIMEVIKSLLSNKIVAGINANIDFDTASLIAEEFNVTVVKKTQTVSLDTHIS
jgi:translation initiation factor IF-2